MMSWQPSCSITLIQLRAELLRKIRDFFYAQHVLEVETPILCQYAGTDPYLDFFTTCRGSGGLFMQTSPEFAMKRLLAAYRGSIYQITKAFRQGESGRFHNPEFSMLEWYRVGFNLQQLMDDIESLLMPLLSGDVFSQHTCRLSYSDVFQRYTGLNPLLFKVEEFQKVAVQKGLIDAQALCKTDHATWLDYLFTCLVQPHLGENSLTLVYDYPSCLPSLARTKKDNPLLVERVEVFLQGMEIGNGYFELSDATEQEARFDKDIVIRTKNGAAKVEKDSRFLAALQSGLPDCSGVAIGLDRLLMIISQATHINDVLTFPIESA